MKAKKDKTFQVGDIVKNVNADILEDVVYTTILTNSKIHMTHVILFEWSPLKLYRTYCFETKKFYMVDYKQIKKIA